MRNRNYERLLVAIYVFVSVCWLHCEYFNEKLTALKSLKLFEYDKLMLFKSLNVSMFKRRETAGIPEHILA